ncbi:MAG: phage baseplate protein [Anaerolineae bacterium]|nr:phage baseplate protein [Anaerolineae bacterium]
MNAMHPLSSQDIVSIWEVGLRQHPLDRALTILHAVYPDVGLQDLAALSIGQRDWHLIALYERLFGRNFSGLLHCPACGEPLEFTVDSDQIRVMHDPDEADGVLEMALDGYDLRFRPANSYDLAAILHCADVQAAQQKLFGRCLLQVSQGGMEVSPEVLPEHAVTAVDEALAARDAQADIRFDLVCPDCQHAWQAAFEVLTFLWAQISAAAQHLLYDVHILAQAYGWSERDILALSESRRRWYLEMANA